MDGLIGFLHRVPAWVFIVVPFAAFMLIVYTVSLAIPTVTANHYLFLLAIFVAVSISRTIQPWEYGIQVYHFLLFWFAFVYGVLSGIAMVVLSFLFVLYFVFYIPKHYFMHTVLGPILNTTALLFVVTVAGLSAKLFPGYVMSNYILFPITISAISTLFEKYGAHRFAGVEIGRLASAQVIEVMINYNLFLFYTYTYLSMLRTI